VPMTVKMNGKTCKAKRQGNLFVVNYIHQIKPIAISFAGD